MTITTQQAPLPLSTPLVHSPCREGTQMLDMFTRIETSRFDWIARNLSNQEIVEAN